WPIGADRLGVLGDAPGVRGVEGLDRRALVRRDDPRGPLDGLERAGILVRRAVVLLIAGIALEVVALVLSEMRVEIRARRDRLRREGLVLPAGRLLGSDDGREVIVGGDRVHDDHVALVVRSELE